MNAPVVHVVDDDLSFRAALTRLLRASGFEVKAFATAEEFFKHLAPDTHGCAVVDLEMPGMNGLELQAALTQASNPIPLVFLTGHGNIPATVRAMRDGAEDFLEKRAPRETLLAAVGRALARDAEARAERDLKRKAEDRFNILTDREREVLGHVLKGRLNKQIAADLGIHERTVKLHRTGITTKLGVHSVAELARIILHGNTFPKGQ